MPGTGTFGFCRGQALFVSGLSCYDEIKTLYSTYWGFNALTGLSCYLKHTHLTSLRQAFQCPHGLELLRLEPIQRAYSKASFNALSGLYLISTRNCLMEGSAEIIVSMPSRAYTSFLQYPFKNLGFMRFPEPVFAGIYQNILTAAVFRAC